jgi:hypothetical protein
MARAVALPDTPAAITSLQATSTEVFYQVRPVQLIGGDLAGEVGTLHALDLVTMKSRISLSDLDNFSLSSNGKRVAFRRNGA